MVKNSRRGRQITESYLKEEIRHVAKPELGDLRMLLVCGYELISFCTIPRHFLIHKKRN